MSIYSKPEHFRYWILLFDGELSHNLINTQWHIIDELANYLRLCLILAAESFHDEWIKTIILDYNLGNFWVNCFWLNNLRFFNSNV